MKALIEHGLICDVVKYDMEQGTYYKLVVYSSGNLTYISIPKETVKNWREAFGTYTDITCTMSTYDGKTKFKIAE